MSQLPTQVDTLSRFVCLSWRDGRELDIAEAHTR